MYTSLEQKDLLFGYLACRHKAMFRGVGRQLHLFIHLYKFLICNFTAFNGVQFTSRSRPYAFQKPKVHHRGEKSHGATVWALHVCVYVPLHDRCSKNAYIDGMCTHVYSILISRYLFSLFCFPLRVLITIHYCFYDWLSYGLKIFKFGTDSRKVPQMWARGDDVSHSTTPLC